MTLIDLIRALEDADPEYVAPLGFSTPMSYRGYYHCVAFEPATNVTVASMLEHARSALGATFTGYKGGNYQMGEHTDCYIAQYGCADGDLIGPVLVAYLTGRAGL